MAYPYHIRVAASPVPFSTETNQVQHAAQPHIYLNFRDYDDEDLADEAVEHFYRVDFDETDHESSDEWFDDTDGNIEL